MPAVDRRTRLPIAPSLWQLVIVSFIVTAVTSGCKTPSVLSESVRRPEGGVAQVEKKRWTDIFRPRPKLEKVDVPVWEIPDRETDVVALQLSYGRWMERAGDRQAAVSAYERVLKEDADHVEATLGLARLSAASGDIEKARKGIASAMSLAPRDPNVLTASGQFELDHGQVDVAADRLLQAVEGNPDATEARYLLGIARARQGRWPEARALFVATVGEAEAHYNLGMLMKDSRPAEAAAEFRAAMSKKPSLKQAGSELARLEEVMGRQAILPASHTVGTLGPGISSPN